MLSAAMLSTMADTRRSPVTYRRPSRIWAHVGGGRAGRGGGGNRTGNKAVRTARNDRPFNRKQTPPPSFPITTPATAGPSTRVTLKADELSAIAFIRSSLPTISTKNDWRGGGG